MNEVSDNQFSILIVDDEADALELTRKLLLGADISPVFAISDSRTVLPFLEHHAVSLIVLDLMMPHITGIELLPLLHRDYPHIPVIISTAACDVETAVECMKAGATDYLVKPIEVSRLVATIKNALNFDHLRHE